jgi:hypothetical protein
MAGFKSGGKGGAAIPGPSIPRTSFVLGSRPPGIRAPSIKPMAASTRQYGKADTVPAPNLGGSNFGNTGQTDMS